jgi:hypothetical protein
MKIITYKFWLHSNNFFKNFGKLVDDDFGAEFKDWRR